MRSLCRCISWLNIFDRFVRISALLNPEALAEDKAVKKVVRQLYKVCLGAKLCISASVAISIATTREEMGKADI